MLSFCTLFDSNYLSRGLAMYESLKNYCSDFHLYIFAFDDKSLEILNKLNLLNTTIISLAEFEDEELLKIKSQRSKAEYCWTCTPSTILYIINNYHVDACIYLDADLLFYASPQILIDEIPDTGSVMITEHRFSEQYMKLIADSGIYCVQFMFFKNNFDGLTVLQWWRNACIDWCYARVEDGKFGDQKYLDDWPDRFKGIHVLKHPGGGVAPWNIQQFEVFTGKNSLYLRKLSSKLEYQLIFYHFHGLKFSKNEVNEIIDLAEYELKNNVKKHIYIPYLKSLEEQKQKIGEIDNSFDPHGSLVYHKKNSNLKEFIRYHLRKIKRIYKPHFNIYLKSELF